MRGASEQGSGRLLREIETAALRRRALPQAWGAVDLNHATARDLAAHPLIDAKLAERIVSLRRKRRLAGPEDLLSAGATSPAQFQKLKRHAFGETPTRPLVTGIQVSEERLHVGEKFNLTVAFVAGALVQPEILRLEVRFPSRRLERRLYRIDARAAARGQVTLSGLVSGEAGELFVRAEIIDAHGTVYACGDVFGVFTRNPVSMYVWPTYNTQSFAAGAPKYDFGAQRWVCPAEIVWVNGTDRTVNLGRKVTVRVTDLGTAVTSFSFNLSGDIVIPPWTSLYGMIQTTHPKTSPVGSRFHAKGDMTFEYEMSGDGHTVLRRQIWRTMLVVGYNIIRVGDFAAAERDAYRQAAGQIASDIFSARDISVHGVELYRVEGDPAQDADKQKYRFINSDDEGRELMDRYTVSNWYLDVFFVEGIYDGSCGFTIGVNGPVDKRGRRSGIVIRRDDDTTNLGQTFAHESGHYLGLEHADDNDGCADTDPSDPHISDNFVFSSSRRDSVDITADQYETMRKHGLVRTLTP